MVRVMRDTTLLMGMLIVWMLILTICFGMISFPGATIGMKLFGFFVAVVQSTIMGAELF